MSVKGISTIFRWRGESSRISWLSLNKEIGSTRCARSTENHFIWNRINGKGFTIFLSDVRLSNSTKEPPEWEAVVESLSQLSPQGKEKFIVVVNTIESYLAEAGVEYEKI